MNAHSAPEPLESRIAPAVIIVTSLLDDSSAGTLRAALQAADHNAGHDTIIFKLPAAPAHGINTITLTQGQLTSKGDVTITGPGAAKLEIDANHDSRVLQIGQPADMSNDHPSVITGLTMVNGQAGSVQDGGGIIAYDSLTLTNVIISGNEPGFNHNVGGGVEVNVTGNFNASVSISNSIFSNNFAEDNGGGLVLFGLHSASITGSTFVNNQCNYSGGGAVDARLARNATAMTISNSTFIGNGAHEGGALELGAYDGASTAKFTISHSTLSGNVATHTNSGNVTGGGAIEALYGNFLITGSTITGNQALAFGGAIYGVLSASVTVSASKIEGNFVSDSGTGHGGGGIFLKGPAPTSPAIPLTITASKISGNHVAGTASGGGIYTNGNVKLVISGSTLSGNYAAVGGAIYATPDSSGHASMSITGSTITGNKAHEAGAIYASGEQNVTITGGSISFNYAAVSSGGMEFNADASVTISGGAITNNVAQAGSGGGVSLFGVAAFHVKGGSISHNFAETDGGGVNTAGSVGGSILGCTITGNIASQGGGIDGGATGTLDVQIAKVTGNIAFTNGTNVFGNVTYA